MINHLASRAAALIVMGLTTSVYAQVPAEVSALPATAPAPSDNPTTPAKVELGRKLYFDPRLSHDGSVSCNSCHNVMNGGTDNRAVSAGVRGQRGDRSSPTVFNAAFLSVQFWDGREPTLEAQAKGPLINPVEMGNKDHNEVVSRLRKIPGYVQEFDKVWGKKDSLNIDHVAQAIAAYERTLITPNSPFDRYAKGDTKALSPAAAKGLQTVKEVGCLSCHSGPNFAGPTLPAGTGFFQKFPTFTGSSYDSKYDLTDDPGRAKATKNDADKHFFRVQTWRNIALTAPYFHNGSVNTLDEAVRVMAKTQLNKELTPEQVTSIVAFLESLTGQVPPQKMPTLPPTLGTAVTELR